MHVTRMSEFLMGLLFCGTALAAQQSAPSSRDMNDMNWMEFREWVPAKISTVLLPTGTLEAHGVVNNGADNTAPLAMARQMAPRLNGLIAPVIPYGVTGSLDAYAGSFSITETAYRAYVGDVLEGLARQGFRNIILLNGHGVGKQEYSRNWLKKLAGNSEFGRWLSTGGPIVPT